MSPMMSTNSSSTSASLLENPPTTTSSSLKFIDFFRRIYDEHYPPGFLKKVLAELIATFLLVFVTCGSAALSNSDESRVSKLGACIAGGLIVTVMIYAVGHVSGAHMNPAVTCAFAAVRHFPWKQVPFYAAAQLTGALVASFTLLILLQPIKNIGTTSPSGTDFQLCSSSTASNTPMKNTTQIYSIIKKVDLKIHPSHNETTKQHRHVKINKPISTNFNLI
ncbi:hypothetical protein MKX03_010029 [Papaver bracteatum]|nr:hypothetical protein MKX03_010029 [Papaver bracteatum]